MNYNPYHYNLSTLLFQRENNEKLISVNYRKFKYKLSDIDHQL